MLRQLSNILLNLNNSLVELWFNSSGFSRIPLGFALWFIGLVMFPFTFIAGIYQLWMIRNDPLDSMIADDIQSIETDMNVWDNDPEDLPF